MASTLFGEVAYRAAFDFFFDEEEAVLDGFAEVFAVLFGALFDVVFAVLFAAAFMFFAALFDAVRDDAAVLLRPRVLLPFTRVPGASFTGSATMMVRPKGTVFDER